MGRVPLDRALSKRGILSRSLSGKAIREGRVKVDGKIINDPNMLVIPEKIKIEIDGKECDSPKEMTILFHKPKGYVTTTSDEKGRPTIYDLLGELQSYHLIPVGRLDMHTSGLLILTNDTQFANFLTDPTNGIQRSYIATVRGDFTPEKKEALLLGIIDKGEELKAYGLEIIKSSGKESILKVTLTEGKNREIRRMLMSLGHEVIKLKRISFGDYELGDLESAKWIEIDRNPKK